MIIPSLLTALRAVGVEEGQTLCVFSDLAKLGIPSEIQELIRREGVRGLALSYLDTLAAALGPQGTLLMPTFTYSACEKTTFSLNRTPSRVGALTEIFRQSPGVIRSAHPIFSFAGRGPAAAELLSLATLDCFGPKSLFDKMIDRSGSYLLLGTTVQAAGTFVYYSLQKKQVPYRQTRIFRGAVESAEGTAEVEVPYFSRDLNATISDDWEELQATGLKTGLIRQSQFNGGDIFLVGSRAADDLVLQALAFDPYALTRANG